MVRPTLAEAQKVNAAEYRLIPIGMEMFADMVTPIGVMKILKSVSQHCFMLESAEDSKVWGRYTFLGFDPTMGVTCRDGAMEVTKSGVSETFETAHPNEHIQKILDDHKSAKFDYLPPFTGGLMGYFSYDYVKYAEPSLVLDAPDTEGFNDVDLMLFDKIIAFDHYRQKIILLANIRTENIEAEYAKGVAELERLRGLISANSGNSGESRNSNCSAPSGAECNNAIMQSRNNAIPPGHLKSEFLAQFDKEAFCTMVEKAKDYIREGEIFQIVLSNRWEADFEGSLFDTYRILRTINPSSYMFYFGGSDVEIAGASPETLVKLQDGKLYTFPLGGTRWRGATDEEDIALERGLLADEKEISEHNQLVDLGRNDLAKVSKIGTVEVEKYLTVLRQSHVMHLGSTVSGKIRDDKTALDAIDAVLPAGTLSGAPKIRTMEIIDELERNKRGIYGGAIGYLDFSGNMDTCIAIRIAYKKNGKVFVRAGAGVVADSNPASEYQECVNKSQAVQNALKQSTGGLI